MYIVVLRCVSEINSGLEDALAEVLDFCRVWVGARVWVCVYGGG